MIDLVFSESAEGSLTYAQGWGDGPCPMPCIGIAYDEKKPAFWKVWQDKRREKKKFRENWNHAVVLKTRKEDIFCLSLGLSQGDIAADGFWRHRKTLLRTDLMERYETDQVERQLQARMEKVKTDLETICNRLAEGENIRIWYGGNAEDHCMLAWFAAKLREKKLPKIQVLLNELPGTMTRPDGVKIQQRSWGEIEPAQWGKLDQELRKEAKRDFLKEQAAIWAQLEEENTALRIWEQGSLHSVPETYYDDRIWAEIEKQPKEFREPEVIGNLIGGGLQMPDTWIARRIETMAAAGKLTVTSEEEPGTHSYRRTLRRV